MSVQRTFAVLEYLARRGSASMRGMARDLGVPVGTTHRLVMSLAEEDLVERTPYGEWRLTYRLVEIVGAQLAHSGLPAQARPVLQEMAAGSGQTAFLATRSGHDVVYLDKVQSDAQVQLYVELGARRPVHATALGKAILAFSPEAERDAVLGAPLPAVTDHTLTDPVRLRGQLDEIAARGYAADKHEVVSGVSCLAAPVFDHTQTVAGAVSIAGLDARLHAEDAELVKLVRAGAAAVSRRLGYKPIDANPEDSR